MKTISKTRPDNVTSFILEGRWPLAGFDQRELRRLSKTAKRNGVGVADVLYEAVESFVAKCEAEADLEEKDPSYSARLKETLAKERATHKANYEALSSIASKILTAKEYPEYQKLKAQEDEVLAGIEVQKLQDKNDVSELRLRVSEFDAERLEIEQRYQ